VGSSLGDKKQENKLLTTDRRKGKKGEKGFEKVTGNSPKENAK